MSKIKEDRIRFSHRRNRSKKTAWFHTDRYRLCVYRSNMNIEAQIIDDFQGNTLISSSSKDKSLAKEIKKATSKINTIPDVIYHLGDWGKEPMILVFGRNPSEVYSKIMSIIKYKNLNYNEF